MARAENFQTSLLSSRAQKATIRRQRIPPSAWLQLALLILLLIFILTPFFLDGLDLAQGAERHFRHPAQDHLHAHAGAL